MKLIAIGIFDKTHGVTQALHVIPQKDKAVSQHILLNIAKEIPHTAFEPEDLFILDDQENMFYYLWAKGEFIYLIASPEKVSDDKSKFKKLRNAFIDLTQVSPDKYSEIEQKLKNIDHVVSDRMIQPLPRRPKHVPDNNLKYDELSSLLDQTDRLANTSINFRKKPTPKNTYPSSSDKVATLFCCLFPCIKQRKKKAHDVELEQSPLGSRRRIF